MNKREKNLFSMYIGVAETLKKFSADVGGKKAFESSFDEFNSMIAAIQEKDSEYLDEKTGKTRDKYDAKSDLISGFLAVTGSCYVYARKSKDNNLKELFRNRPSYLENMREVDLLNRVRTVYSKLDSLSAEMADYVDAAEITALGDKITAFEDALKAGEGGSAASSSIRGQLADLFKETSELLNEEIDFFMDAFEDANPDFYKQYQAARNINDG